MTADYKANIWKFYLYRSISQFELTMAIFVLFLLANRLSMTEIMLLETIFIIAVLVLEVPSGAFADLYGRKLTLAIAIISGAVGFAIFGFGTAFWMFLIAQLFVAAGLALTTGADSAFIYDTLKELKREKEYPRFEGKASFFAMLVYTAASLAGGFLAVMLGYRPLFFLTAIIFSIGFLVALFFKEPPIHKHLQEKDYLGHLKKAVKFTYEHRLIRNLIIYYGLFAALGHITWLVLQPYYDQSPLSKFMVGVALAVYFITAGFGYLWAGFFTKRIPEKKLLYWLLLLAALSFIGIYFVNPWIALILIGIMSFLCGVRDIAINKDIHKHTASHQRATVISVKSMSKSLMYAIAAPLIGLFMDVYSPGATFFMMGVGLMIFFVYILFLFRAQKHENYINP